MAYSLFDKIAYFLNYYLKLGIPEKQINFRNVWNTGPERNAPLRQIFEKSENWPMRGLYWLSKDFFDETIKETTEPDARALADLRNHLEHKYLKVHQISVPKADVPRIMVMDDLAYSISHSDLKKKSLRVLKMARAALIYLSLGMHREEKRRREDEKPNGLFAQMPVTTWEDEWKQ